MGDGCSGIGACGCVLRPCLLTGLHRSVGKEPLVLCLSGKIGSFRRCVDGCCLPLGQRHGVGGGTDDLCGCLRFQDHQWSLPLECLISSSVAIGLGAAGTATEGDPIRTWSTSRSQGIHPFLWENSRCCSPPETAGFILSQRLAT